jgi:hypothetical protein
VVVRKVEKESSEFRKKAVVTTVQMKRSECVRVKWMLGGKVRRERRRMRKRRRGGAREKRGG